MSDPTLFSVTCDDCGFDGFVQAPDDADSNLTLANCPQCGAALLGYSQALSQVNRIALMEDMLRWLNGRLILTGGDAQP